MASQEDMVLLIKSLIISQKGGLPLKDLNREYRSESGEEIEYKKFGFKTLQDFLKNNGLLVEPRQGELHVIVNSSEKSAHIMALVSEQKSPVKKRKKRPRSAPGRTQGHIIRPSAKRSTAVLKNYKSTVNLNESSNPVKKPPQLMKSLITTTSASSDIRGIPFVVVNKKSEPLEKDTDDNKENNIKEKNVNLKITISNSNVRERKVEISEVGKNVNRVRFVVSQECDACECPSINGYTLFGDNFFFEFALYLNYPMSNNESIGMCQRKLTLLDAYNIFHSRIHFPKKIMICLGATDIILGNDFEEIAYNLYSLLNDVSNLVEKIVVCTIPPLLNIRKVHFENLLRTNRLLECVPEDLDRKMKIINLYELISASQLSNKADLYNVNGELLMTFNSKGHHFLEKIFNKYLK